MLTPKIVLLCDEKMLRELVAGSLRQSAPELEIFEADGIAEVDSTTASAAAVVAIMKGSATTEEIVCELAAAQKIARNASFAIISDFRDCELIRQAFENGVSGFISTRMSAASLVNYMRLLAIHDEVMSPHVMQAMSANGITTTQQTSAAGPIDDLPEIAREVLERVRQGKPNKTIGIELGLGENEVKLRVRSLMRKFGVKNRVQLVLATNKRQPPPAVASAPRGAGKS